MEPQLRSLERSRAWSRSWVTGALRSVEQELGHWSTPEHGAADEVTGALRSMELELRSLEHSGAWSRS
ncbi:UNVERIFIED_CONTAM: hypothetical protein FKN15_058917 [Acipenser sinensis]